MEISEDNNLSSNPESLGANELEQSSSINNSSEPVDEINIINEQSEHNSISINNGTNQTENLIQSHVSPRLPHDKITRNQIAESDNNHSDGGNEENYNEANDNSMTVDSTRDETMMENLQDRLTSMRDGFLEKYSFFFNRFLRLLFLGGIRSGLLISEKNVFFKSLLTRWINLNFSSALKL